MWGAISRIQEAGMIPGIWLAPFVTVEPQETKVDFLLRQFMKCARPNLHGFDRLYPIRYNDRNAMQKVMQSILKFYEAGVRLFKFDYNLYFFWQEGAFLDILAEYQNFYRELRRYMPNAMFIGCGVPLFDSIGLFDFMRVTMDSKVFPPRYDRMTDYAQELRNRNIINSLAVRWPLNGVFWWQDLDIVNSTAAFLANMNGINLVGVPQQQFYRELMG